MTKQTKTDINQTDMNMKLVQEKVDAQFGNKNHLSLLLNKPSRSQILNPKQTLGIESLKMKTFYDDKSITHNNLK